MKSILPQMKHKPKYIFLENVKNFETSQSHELLITTLCSLGYVFKEYLLSPTQIQIPNERLRYYLCAQHISSSPIDLSTVKPIVAQFPCTPTHPVRNCISQYLMESANNQEDLQVPHHVLIKNKGYRYDIIEPSSTYSSCITKGYGTLSHVKGTGPLLTLKAHEKIIDWNDANTLIPLHLRLLHPDEISQILGFPVGFKFPEHLSTVQCHKLLGNSLNVTVVYLLMTSTFSQ
ncbi:tRNA (cytosine(38)-C(5))-methyltransferase [Acrasis kona]|uniref:tRNA (Cytosine(38)-C(5))-methyltransferase n=1 Tax=Acrasis kona TaxID=1008807 RepID=A0AAW2ZQT2_9EUKA